MLLSNSDIRALLVSFGAFAYSGYRVSQGGFFMPAAIFSGALVVSAATLQKAVGKNDPNAPAGISFVIPQEDGSKQYVRIHGTQSLP